MPQDVTTGMFCATVIINEIRRSIEASRIGSGKCLCA